MDSNPFATRYITAGAIDFIFSEEEQSLASLAERFVNLPSRRASIVGPHGTGKSTLLSHLIDSQFGAKAERNLAVHRVNLTRNGSSLKQLWTNKAIWNGQTILIVDGYEQIGWLNRARLLQATQRTGVRLLITTHYHIRQFEVIYRSHCDALIDTKILTVLLKNTAICPVSIIESAWWRQSRGRYPNNLRESLLEAYDWYESQRSLASKLSRNNFRNFV